MEGEGLWVANERSESQFSECYGSGPWTAPLLPSAREGVTAGHGMFESSHHHAWIIDALFFGLVVAVVAVVVVAAIKLVVSNTPYLGDLLLRPCGHGFCVSDSFASVGVSHAAARPRRGDGD